MYISTYLKASRALVYHDWELRHVICLLWGSNGVTLSVESSIEDHDFLGMLWTVRRVICLLLWSNAWLYRREVRLKIITFWADAMASEICDLSVIVRSWRDFFDGKVDWRSWLLIMLWPMRLVFPSSIRRIEFWPCHMGRAFAVFPKLHRGDLFNWMHKREEKKIQFSN